MRFDEDDPLAVWGDLGKAVAHPVLRRAGDRLGHSAFAVVKGNPVEIVLNLHFERVVGVGGHLAVGAVRIRNGAGEDEVLPVVTPDGV